MKRTSVHIKNMWTKQLCNHKVWDLATAFRMRKLFGPTERATGLFVLVSFFFKSCLHSLELTKLKHKGVYITTAMTPRTAISIKKRIYILPGNLAILLSHLLCFCLSKLSRKWIWDLTQCKIQNIKLSVVVHIIHTTQNLVISRCCFAEQRMAKKCTMN